jgi:hypothetical protein
VAKKSSADDVSKAIRIYLNTSKRKTSGSENRPLTHLTDGPAYTLQGTPATASTRGIVIQNRQKVIRK